MNTPKLPPLPPQSSKVFGTAIGPVKVLAYSAEDMQAYAIAAIEAQGVLDALREEAMNLASILSGMVEGGYSDLETLYTEDQSDGDAFVKRAAEVLGLLASAPPAPQVVPRKIPIPPAQAEMLDVVYAEGWNQCCDTFFGGLPPQEPVVITITERDEAPAPQAKDDSAASVNDTNAALAGRYFELLKVVEQYEKSGVTCQTYRHFIAEPCAECNSPGICGKQASVVQQGPIYQLQLSSGDWTDQSEASYQYNLKSFPDLVRVVYTHPAQQAKPQPLSDDELLAAWNESAACRGSLGSCRMAFVEGARYAEAARAIESATCAERDKRIAELEENERAFKQLSLQMQDSIDFLQKKLNTSNAENRPLGYYEFDEIG